MNSDPLDESDSEENRSESDATPEESETEPERSEGDESGGLLGRRTVLAGFLGGVTAVLAALALNPDPIREFLEPTHENVDEDAWLDRSSEEAETEGAVSGTVRLESGQYTTQQLWARSAGAELSWSVSGLDEGTVDVWVLPDDQFDSYRDRGDPGFNAELSESGVASETEQAGEVTDGDWWILLDNSSVYGADADGDVEFDVEMAIRAD